MRKPEHSRTFHNLVEKAKATTRVSIARYCLVYEWLWSAIYGHPTKEQMEKIEIYLEMQRIMSGMRGIYSSEEDKQILKQLDRTCMEKIREVHEGYYLSINIQLE